MTPKDATTSEHNRVLAAYLRDHLAGAAAGLALAGRCRRANDGTSLGDLLTDVELEIAEDREDLVKIMERLDVTENQVKSMAARAGEWVGRLKRNGTLFRRSPSSPVVELEGLLAGIDAKRSLWCSLRAAAATRPELDADRLGQLIDRATSQHDRLTAEHDRVAGDAFSTIAA
jgi:hypothetical protein